MPTEQDVGLAAAGHAAAGHAVARLARHLDRALADLELTTAQFRVLGMLAEGSSAATLLADRLAVSAPNVTGLVDGLVARGLVERRADPGDRRRHALTLTPKGRRQLRTAEQAIEARLTELAGHLGAADGAALLGSLARWSDALDLARQAKLQAKADGASKADGR